MSFGRNPHIAKAQLAEQKAQESQDAGSRERLWREAAHLWDRAAKKEVDDKRKAEYENNAQQAREKADQPPPPDENPVGALIVRLAELQKKKKPQDD
jgi:hypothetical protein